MATYTKSTKKMERKPDENANANANGNADAVLISTVIKFRVVKLALSEPLLVKMASFEDKTASSENFLAKSIENSNAISISTGTKPSEMEPALPVSFEDIYFDASDKETPTEDIPATTNMPVTSSAVVLAAVPTKTEAASIGGPPVLSIENEEAPPLPSTPEEKVFSLATAVMAGIEKHGSLCKQITNIIPTINTAYSADVSAVQNKLSSMKDAQGSCCDALLSWEALRCEFWAMRAAAPGIIIETELFPEENNLFLDVSGQQKSLELVHLQISELIKRQCLLVTPTTTPVYGMAPSDFSNLTNAPVTGSAAAPAAAAFFVSEKINETKREKKLAPRTPPVSEMASADFPPHLLPHPLLHLLLLLLLQSQKLRSLLPFSLNQLPLPLQQLPQPL
jgi:hypothetical protein